VKVPASNALLVLLRNLLISREPLYGIGQWAVGYASDLLGLTPAEWEALSDDGVGRALGELFRGEQGALVLAVVRQTVRAFQVALQQLYNDSTTITFHGSYEDAAEEGHRRGRPTLAITWGHNKDHRPDLKQLVYILTLSDDGGAPVHFRAASGNTTDDRTHIETWELLCELADHRDFLYVADSKLATAGNMAYLHQHGGRFITVLPRTRYRQRRKVAEAVAEILASREVKDWGRVTIEERVDEYYRQVGRGRPTKDTRYAKEVSLRFDLSYQIDYVRIAEDQRCDGVFPLVTNVLDLGEREVLLVYKRQLTIEKRFSQLRTDFRVASVYLKEVSRIQTLLCVYFLVLVLEALLERQLRQAMDREGIDSLPLYPEDHPCRHPTARRVIDLFDGISRYTLRRDGPKPRPRSSPSYPTSNAASSSFSASRPLPTTPDLRPEDKFGENERRMFGKADERQS